MSSAVLQEPVATMEHKRPELRAVYREHFRHVWLTLRRLGVRDRDLEDLVHEVFVVVHRRLNDYDPTRPLRPWLTGIAFRVAADERKRAYHQRELPDEQQDHADDTPDPECQAARRQDRALVLAALRELSPDRRVIFVMHEIDGHRMPEIAEALEVPLNTCYSRLRLGRIDFASAVRRLRGGEGDDDR